MTRRRIATSNATGSRRRWATSGAELPRRPDGPRAARAAARRLRRRCSSTSPVGYRGFEFFQFSQNVNELGRSRRSEIRTVPRQRRASRRSARTPAASGTHVQPDDRRPVGERQIQLEIASDARPHDDRHRRRPDEPGHAGRQSDEPEPDRVARRPHRANVIVPRSSPTRDEVVLAPRAERLAVLQRPGHPELSAPTGSTGGRRTPTRASFSSSPTSCTLRRPGPLPGPGRRVEVGLLGLLDRRTRTGWSAGTSKDGTRLVPAPAPPA